MTRFMTLDFADGDRTQMLARVLEMARGAYGYVVTPNVDHVVKLMDGRVGRVVAGRGQDRRFFGRTQALLGPQDRPRIEPFDVEPL